ncbi:MAG: glycosyltransferase, partial [Deltaproteobacteria bacterium]|nr:glycosyltransferase [Deltaproteobacteria bacterium]
GCTDDTLKVIEPYLDDPRLVLIDLPHSIGGAGARNMGLDRATGEYVAFLDDDDEWVAAKLEKQIRFIQTHPDTAVVSCNYTFDRGMPSRLKSLVTLHDLLYHNFLGSFSFCLTRRSYLDGLRINPDLRGCQDWDLWLKVLKKTGRPGRNIGEVLVHYYTDDEHRLSRDFQISYEAYVMQVNLLWPLLDRKHRMFHRMKMEVLKKMAEPGLFGIPDLLDILKHLIIFLYTGPYREPRFLAGTVLAPYFDYQTKKAIKDRLGKLIGPGRYT